MSLFRSAIEKRHNRKATSEDEQASLREIQKYLGQDSSRAEFEDCSRRKEHGHRASSRQSSRQSPRYQIHDSTQQEEPNNFSRSPRGRDSQGDKDRPKHLVFSNCEFRQFERGTGNDADHGRPDTVEHSLHPRQSAETNVSG